MKGRHAASGWSPFWRDILLRSFLVVLLVAMAVFIWWLFSEDDLFTEAVSTTSETGEVATTQAPSTTSGTRPPITTATTTTAASETTVAEVVTSTTSPSTSTTSTAPPPLGPDELVVKVFNANGVGGVAGRTTARLEEAGYGVAGPDNHTQFLDISRVWYRQGLMREAEHLRETLIPDALVELISSEQEGIDIVVMLGRSFAE